MFRYLRRTVHGFLMSIAFLEYPTTLVGDSLSHPQYASGGRTRLRGFLCVFGGIMFTLVWIHATNDHRLTDRDLDLRMVTSMSHVCILGATPSVVAMALAFVSP